MKHTYEATIVWNGAGTSTAAYASYSREYGARMNGKPDLTGSADPSFRGDARLYNPEDLLLISLSACHMLSYLAICARKGIEIVSYEDRASGTMAVREGAMRFVEVVLRPHVVVPGGATIEHETYHEQAHRECFIANSVNFTVRHEARTVAG
ncbi:MAG TPA: OsmC family protein [Candidatus Baltobacteraceae bacterium]